jgi:hypothetical protein
MTDDKRRKTENGSIGSPEGGRRTERRSGVRTRKCAYWLISLLIALAVSGCATIGKIKPIEPESIGQRPVNAEKGWWYARFHMVWPPDKDPAWYVDLILAHRVVSPVLDQYEKEIPLWRFHRRAGRDQAGHEFSFIFYASRETARKVYRGIESSRLLKELIAAHLVAGTVFDDTTGVLRSGLGDTSDRNWSPEIKRTWPFYIMGVSRTWLNLIDEISKETMKEKDLSNLEDLEEGYRKVNQVIEDKWRQEGGHAFLHHLNAIFGYEPLYIYERRLTNF